MLLPHLLLEMMHGWGVRSLMGYSPVLSQPSCVPLGPLFGPPSLCHYMVKRLSNFWEVKIFLGKNTGVGCHFLPQGIFLTQGSNPCLLQCRWILYHWATMEAPWSLRSDNVNPYDTALLPHYQLIRELLTSWSHTVGYPSLTWPLKMPYWKPSGTLGLVSTVWDSLQ